MIYKIPLDTLDATKATAQLLASCLPDTGAITFKGNMGAGKTTFIARIIEAIFEKHKCDAPIVTSPTFSLVHEYKIDNKTIAHFDLFRLKNPNDVLNLGFDDYLDTALCFIEWPQNAEQYLDNIILKCSFTVQNDRRILTLYPCEGYSLDKEKFNSYAV